LLLLVASEAHLEGGLARWPGLRELFCRLGAPVGAGLHGGTLRLIAQELLVELGLRPRPDGPLVAVSPGVFWRAFRGRR